MRWLNIMVVLSYEHYFVGRSLVDNKTPQLFSNIKISGF